MAPLQLIQIWPRTEVLPGKAHAAELGAEIPVTFGHSGLARFLVDPYVDVFVGVFVILTPVKERT